MAQIIHTGIVVNIDYAGHPDLVQVRIPILHGIPWDLNTAFATTNDNGSLAIRLLQNSSYGTDSSTTALTVDKDLPWFPVAYPFGSKIGPVQGDLVYIVMETTESIKGLIVGWTGHQVVYQTTGSEAADEGNSKEYAKTYAEHIHNLMGTT